MLNICFYIIYNTIPKINVAERAVILENVLLLYKIPLLYLTGYLYASREFKKLFLSYTSFSLVNIFFTLRKKITQKPVELKSANKKCSFLEEIP